MEPLPPSLLELNAYLLSKVGKTARQSAATRLAEHGLLMRHLAVLAALGDFGPHIQRDLAVRLGQDPSDIVKTLDDLAARGQIERTRDPADRRRSAVSLTDEGRRALADLLDESTAAEDELLAPLSPAERELLHALLLRLL
ncbi:MAG TPA: MarR family transcriptional regulator [Actinospica sp.]|jgi:DNA-binding MarR family transcriptional regulator|nr:MarR family transcriptional regulator [Actinospica sp.]